MPQSLSIALKEWKIICDLLLDGSLALLLRKGGIHESGGPGVFEIEHARFLLFPSWAHQKPEMLRADVRPRVEMIDEPESITLRGLAEVAHIWEVPSRGALDRLDDPHADTAAPRRTPMRPPLHPWTAAQLDMRWNYRPENPLYLVAVRAFSLAEPIMIPNRVRYGGCRSWVPLEPEDAVSAEPVAAAKPVLPDAALRAIVDRVNEAFG